MNDELVLKNMPLIYKCIKDMRLYWNTEDEFQNYYDAGLIGLINGVKHYDESKSMPSTYLYQCIKNEIGHEIIMSNTQKRIINKMYKTSLSEVVSNDSDLTYLDLLVDPNVDIENDIIKKEKIEELINAVNQLTNEKDKLFICEFYGLMGYERLSSKDIQKKYSITHQAVYTRLTRAKRKLKKYLEKKEEKCKNNTSKNLKK